MPQDVIVDTPAASASSAATPPGELKAPGQAAAAVTAEAPAAIERRRFTVEATLLHDGNEYAAGNLVALTGAELDTLRRAGVVDPGHGWLDGEADTEV